MCWRNKSMRSAGAARKPGKRPKALPPTQSGNIPENQKPIGRRRSVIESQSTPAPGRPSTATGRTQPATLRRTRFHFLLKLGASKRGREGVKARMREESNPLLQGNRDMLSIDARIKTNPRKTPFRVEFMPAAPPARRGPMDWHCFEPQAAAAGNNRKQSKALAYLE